MSKIEIQSISRVLKILITNPYSPSDNKYSEEKLIKILEIIGFKYLLKDET